MLCARVGDDIQQVAVLALVVGTTMALVSGRTDAPSTLISPSLSLFWSSLPLPVLLGLLGPLFLFSTNVEL